MLNNVMPQRGTFFNLLGCAYALFLFTAVAGRLWCGFACPQTVYTEIFLWIERVVEGDRNKRIKLDAAPNDFRKIGLKVLKYFLWISLSVWTGITFVGYFTPIREVVGGLVDFKLSGWEAFWLLFYSAFTYLMAGVMREQVCKYMCPYARFQSVMFDSDTLVITYDQARGESRGPRKKGEEHRKAGLGDCVDCGICVQVCPTGIDIRNGLQYECIGCTACIDACDQVMVKMDYPRGLIRYSTENALKQHWGPQEILRHVFRPRILIYMAVLGAICVAFIWGLLSRQEVRVDVIKDRTILSREVEGGLVENVYILQVMNMGEQPKQLRLSVEGFPGIALDGASVLPVDAAHHKTSTVRVRVPVDEVTKGSHEIHFVIRTEEGPPLMLREKAVFISP